MILFAFEPHGPDPSQGEPDDDWSQNPKDEDFNRENSRPKWCIIEEKFIGFITDDNQEEQNGERPLEQGKLTLDIESMII